MRRRLLIALAIVALLACSGSVRAAGLASPLGAMAGLVTDPQGAPQMGAAVFLIASDGRTVRQVYTDDQGAFVLDRVVPGLYSIRVTLASFLPTLKQNVLIQPGVHSFLSINLSSLFSAVDLLRGKKPVSESDDDWKWVLRSTAENRPLFRYLPVSTQTTKHAQAAVPDAPTVLHFSGGEGRSTNYGSEADFNTSFALANQIFDHTSLFLSGNVGYERRTPATAFRGVLRRELADGSTPEISVTLRQIFLPAAFWPSANRDDMMQSLSVNASNRLMISESLRLEYGFLYDSISFLHRMNSFSPYGKLIYEPTDRTLFQVGYTEGAPQPRMTGGGTLYEMASDLAIFPRFSVHNNTPTVQTGRHVEGTVQHKFGARTTASAGVFRDEVNNAALSSLNTGQPPMSNDFFPDVFTSNYSFNAGSYRSKGVRAAVQEKFSDRLEATVAYSYSGMLSPERSFLYTNDPEELRGILQMERRHSIAARFAADIPVTKTRVFASYKWILGMGVAGGDLYDETMGQAEPNLNVVIRQPLPAFILLPGRVEAVADFRNLLAQGYVPILTADGQHLMLVQNARSFRGGFSFRF